ncbi:MAG: 50S ribosomal L9 C-terminal domain-containing protein, partial [Dehalococcoidia bacterium]
GRLYGSVTTSDIAERLDAILESPIDRRRIMLTTPLREVGSRQIPLRLTRNVSTSVEVVIEADESSTRGRRSSAPAGGSIIMAPRRGRAAQEEMEREPAEGEEPEGEDELPALEEEASVVAAEEQEGEEPDESDESTEFDDEEA